MMLWLKVRLETVFTLTIFEKFKSAKTTKNEPCKSVVMYTTLYFIFLR